VAEADADDTDPAALQTPPREFNEADNPLVVVKGVEFGAGD